MTGQELRIGKEGRSGDKASNEPLRAVIADDDPFADNYTLADNDALADNDPLGVERLVCENKRPAGSEMLAQGYAL